MRHFFMLLVLLLVSESIDNNIIEVTVATNQFPLVATLGTVE